MNGSKAMFRYTKVYDELRNQLANGHYPLGTRLPSEQQLQENYEVSRDTLRKALHKLEQDGFIQRKAGKGTFVISNRADYPLTRMEGFTEQMLRRGFVPSSEILSIEQKSEYDKEVTIALNLDPGEKIYAITRIRMADGNPMAYEITHVPQRLFPDIQLHLNQYASLTTIYTENYGMKIFSGRVQIDAVMPTPAIQKYLGITADIPLLKLTSTNFVSNGSPIDFVYSYHISERYEFIATVYR